MKRPQQLWHELVIELAAFSLLTVCVALLWRNNLLLFVIMLAECTVVLCLWHDRLDCYQVALEFSAWVERISPRIPRGRAHLRDQLVRASDSIVLNIAEGAAVPGGTCPPCRPR